MEDKDQKVQSKEDTYTKFKGKKIPDGEFVRYIMKGVATDGKTEVECEVCHKKYIYEAHKKKGLLVKHIANISNSRAKEEAKDRKEKLYAKRGKNE